MDADAACPVAGHDADGYDLYSGEFRSDPPHLSEWATGQPARIAVN